MDLWEASDLCTPWCIHTAVTLRVAEHIQAGQTHIAELAAAVGADESTLERVLRQLVSRGIFQEPSPQVFVLNDIGRQLLDSKFRLGLDLNGIGGRLAHAWSTLPEAVRTGAPAYHRAFGLPFWDDLEHNPEIAASFDEMIGPGGHGAPDPDVLIHPDDWQQIRTVVDVGGGTGSLLAEILRAQPHTSGILVDLPRTVARSSEIFDAAGVADRAKSVGQSFFDPLPAGADLYLLKSVLSNWPDREALTILRRCAEAAKPHGRIILVNGVVADDVAPPDLLMLVLVGGKIRTLAEFGKLAAKAGLTVRDTAQRAGRFLVECVPA